MALENLGPLRHSKPFSRVEVVFAEPISLARGMAAESFENERLKLESLLVSGTDDA